MSSCTRLAQQRLFITLPCHDNCPEVIDTAFLTGPKPHGDDCEMTCVTSEMTRSTYSNQKVVHKEMPLLASIIEEEHHEEEQSHTA